jgi:hypothetical protein
MSVMAMAQMATPARRTKPKEESDPERALRLIAAYIPSEALAVYLALLGILVPVAGTPGGQVFAVRLITFVVGLALVVSLVYLSYKPAPQETAATSNKKRFLLSVLAVIAFAAYSIATPGGILTDLAFLGIASTIWGGAAAIVLALVLPYAADKLGLRASGA